MSALPSPPDAPVKRRPGRPTKPLDQTVVAALRREGFSVYAIMAEVGGSRHPVENALLAAGFRLGKHVLQGDGFKQTYRAKPREASDAGTKQR